MQKVHLGCGDKRLSGYIHVDARDLPGIDYVAESNSLPFEDNSIDEIYFCHGIEHVPQHQLNDTLQEFYRVLRVDGILRLAVPDFEKIVVAYSYGIHLERMFGYLMGRQDYEQNQHYNVFDYERLAGILRENRFYDIRPWSPEEIHPKGYRDYSYAKITAKDGLEIKWSLNLEAKKF